MTVHNDIVELPNQYHLSGHGVSVDISTTSITGAPQVLYQDAHGAQTFTGEQVTIEDTAFGRAVTVAISRTVDAGYTSFTVLLPTLNLARGGHHVDTLGIVGLHRTPLTGIGHGQSTTYSTVSLHGSAAQVESLTAGA